MKKHSTLRALTVIGCVASVHLACSDDGGDSGGSGGAFAAGGSGATGGDASMGGDVSMGGEMPIEDAPDIVDCAGVTADVVIETELPNFNPSGAVIEVGDVVEWENTGTVDHTTTSGELTDAPMWDSGEFSPGESVCVRFDEVGTYSYNCTIHPNTMQGTITVSD